MAGDTWASDVPISHPAAVDQSQPGLVDFGGFSFSTGGIVHHLTEDDLDEVFSPTYAPRPDDGG